MGSTWLISHARRQNAFTLLEVLVASVVAAVLLAIVLSAMSTTSKLWRDSTVKMQTFSDTRAAFTRLSQGLNQAILNPYWDYDTLPFPTKYERYSELQFLTCRMSQLGSAYPANYFPTFGVFFQAPSGMTGDMTNYGNLPGLLNAYGYFIEFGDDNAERPGFLPATISKRYRFRLKQWQLPAEDFKLYSQSATTNGKSFLGTASLGWINFSNVVPRTLAENVIALIILPRGSEASGTVGEPMTTNYYYNSRNDGSSSLERSQKHQLPPTVELVMIAMDEASARRVQGDSMEPPQLVQGSLFEDPRNLEPDIQALLSTLDGQNIRYVVLRSMVTIGAAPVELITP